MIEKSKLKVNFYDGTTPRSKLDLYVCSSGFQKSIRRGDLEDSLNYTKEFIESGNINYLWKRIFVILVEDIWLANLSLWEIIFKLYKNFKKQETETHIEEKYIYQSVLLLLFSPKSRENDNFYHYIKTFNQGDKEELKFFNKFCNPYFYEKKNKKNLNELLILLNETFKEEIPSEIFNSYLNCMLELRGLNGKSELNLYFINFFLVSKYKIKEFNRDYLSQTLSKIPKVLNLDKLPIIIPKDYIYDKHTSKGKLLKRDTNHFFKEGSLLVNEIKVWENKYTDFIKSKFL